jgi:hypothetical protein
MTKASTARVLIDERPRLMGLRTVVLKT